MGHHITFRSNAVAFFTGRAVVVAVLLGATLAGHGQGTAFTYQGRLNNGNGLANGSHDLVFAVYDTNAPAGNLVAGPVTNAAVGVSNGLFTVTLDFGAGVFTGDPRWLEIAVRTNGGSSFTTLAPRQQITATPHAIMANTASNLLGTLTSANLAGTYGNPVTLNNGANTFAGDGSGLVDLNASQLVTGTVPNARLASNVAFLNSNQVFTAQNVFTQPVGIGMTPVFALDVQSAQAVGRFTSTNAGYGSVVELRNLSTNANQYLGAFNFNNAAGTFPGQIGYITPNSTNQNNDVMQFSVGGSTGLRLVADSRGLGAPSVVGGYPGNAVSPINSGGNVIAGGGYGGGFNLVLSNTSGAFIGGGSANQVGPNFNDSAIVGGYGNIVQSPDVFIGGGYGNLVQANAYDSYIGGGQQNQVLTGGNFSTIVGGYYNIIEGSGYYGMSFIGAGWANTIRSNANYSVIAGGINNVIQPSAGYSVIGGGYANTAGSSYDSISGGGANSIGTNSPYAVIAGGYNNLIVANSTGDSIGGGMFNMAVGYCSTVAGGYGSQATSDQSFAAGSYASAIHRGAFVLSDSQNAYFYSTVPDQLSARFQGGVRFITGNIGMTIDGSQVLVSGGLGDGSGLFSLNASQLTSGTVPLARLGGITGSQMDPVAWQLATNLDGGRAAVATNVVAGISITNAFITNSSFAGNGGGLTNLNASQLASGTVPLARLGGLTGNQLDVTTWQLATNLNGGNAALATNVVSGINITNAFITNSVFAGNGGGLTNLNASQLAGGTIPLAQLPGAVVTNNGGGLNLAGTFTGNGTGLTNVNAAALGGLVAANFWQLGGNNVAAGQFIGSTNNQPVELWVNRGRALRVDGGTGGFFIPGYGITPNLTGGNASNTVAADPSGNTGNVISGGGSTNLPQQILGTYNAIPGGLGNNVEGVASLAAGQQNTVTNSTASVALGLFNTAAGYGSFAIGNNCAATGGFSFAFGSGNLATAGNSFALGFGAQALHPGAFVWADNTGGSFASTATNQFVIRAQGGVGINTNNPGNNALLVNGAVQVTGLLRSGSETGTSEAPSPAGLVVRRINSINITSNQVIAISRIPGGNTNVTLIRDGTIGGFVIQYPAAAAARLTIACMGMDNTGAQKNFYTTIVNPAVAGIVQVYTNSQNIVHFECSFGDTYNSTHLTQVTLSRANGDNFWSGNVISTVNQ